MKRAGITLSALIISVFASPAAFASPTTYNIVFSGTGTLPTSGSFTYDPTNPTNGFSNFTVVDGETLGFTSAANNPFSSGSVCGGAGGSTVGFAVMDQGCAPGGSYGWSLSQAGITIEGEFNYFLSDTQEANIAINPTGFIAGDGSGTFTIEPQSSATPEPGSIPLLLASLTAIAVSGRWARRRRTV
jgi:hypothetical protein